MDGCQTPNRGFAPDTSKEAVKVKTAIAMMNASAGVERRPDGPGCLLNYSIIANLVEEDD